MRKDFPAFHFLSSNLKGKMNYGSCGKCLSNPPNVSVDEYFEFFIFSENICTFPLAVLRLWKVTGFGADFALSVGIHREYMF